MLRLSGALMTVALCCAAVLGLIYRQTAPVIAEQKEILMENSLRAVLPAESYERKEEAGGYFAAYDARGEVIGWVLMPQPRGYGGTMQLMAGVNPQGELTGVKILEHKETPGLGSRVAEENFIRQFSGKTVERLHLGGGIDAVTGATISSRAVTEGVREAVREFLAETDK